MTAGCFCDAAYVESPDPHEENLFLQSARPHDITPRGPNYYRGELLNPEVKRNSDPNSNGIPLLNGGRKSPLR